MTATRSPTARPSTSDPNASITPAASTPSCAGKVALVADLPDRIRTSPRFRPIALIRKRTSLGPGSGTTTSSIFSTSGPPNSWNRTLRFMEHAILVGRDVHTPGPAGGDRSITFVAGVPSEAHGFGG